MMMREDLDPGHLAPQCRTVVPEQLGTLASRPKLSVRWHRYLPSSGCPLGFSGASMARALDDLTASALWESWPAGQCPTAFGQCSLCGLKGGELTGAAVGWPGRQKRRPGEVTRKQAVGLLHLVRESPGRSQHPVCGQGRVQGTVGRDSQRTAGWQAGAGPRL